MLSVGLGSLRNVEWCVERWVRIGLVLSVFGMGIGLDSLWNVVVLSVGLDSLWNVGWCVERWVRLFVECGVVC